MDVCNTVIFSLTILHLIVQKNHKKESYLDMGLRDIPFQCNIVMQATVFVVFNFIAQRSIKGVMNE